MFSKEKLEKSVQ